MDQTKKGDVGESSDGTEAATSKIPQKAVDSAAISNHQPQADIFKLDIDSFEELCEYLPLKDLISIGDTCKRLNQMAGYILLKNYSATKATIAGGYGKPKMTVANGVGESNNFNPFIRKIDIRCNDGLDWFHSIQSKFQRLKRINLLWIDLSLAKIERFKEVFSKIEHLGLYNCTLSGNLYENILAFCPNIKRLHIVRQTYSNEVLFGDGWPIKQAYPTLEYLGLDVLNGTVFFDDFLTFMELNPNIRQLAFPDFFLENDSFEFYFLNSTVAVDDLAIKLSGFSDGARIFDLLNKLHARGFYKRLKVYVSSSELEIFTVEQLISLNAVVKLHGNFFIYNDIEVSRIDSLEEIGLKSNYLYNYNFSDNVDFSTNLTNLERIEFRSESFDGLMPFIRNAPKLKKIKVKELEEGLYFRKYHKIVNLKALNREREKLARARKITIYVQQDVYLATKWAFGETDFSLIQLKREETDEWEQDFSESSTL